MSRADWIQEQNPSEISRTNQKASTDDFLAVGLALRISTVETEILFHFLAISYIYATAWVSYCCSR